MRFSNDCPQVPRIGCNVQYGSHNMKLTNNARVGVIGGGPSGSMAGFFLIELAQRIGLNLFVDIYESRDYGRYGPAGCNMCAGVVSESLVQTLAAEGIELPPLVVQRGIDAYILHTSDLEPVSIPTPAEELRIATVYRGSGPKAPSEDQDWASFDDYLLRLAEKKGARILPHRVTGLSWDQGRPRVSSRKQPGRTYDFLIGAVGVNSPTLKQFSDLGFSFLPPPVSKGFVSEIYLGVDRVKKYLGSAMHVFLLDIPRLKFAAIIPKVEFATVCLLGENIDKTLVDRFMNAPEVKSCFPPDLEWCFGGKSCDVGQSCQCAPKLNIGPAVNPYGDRVILVGDSAISRLYKDGIGAAYITAKSCAVAALFFGISKRHLEEYYAPIVRNMAQDNRIGILIFFITTFYQKIRFLRRGMVRMVLAEKRLPGSRRRMSRVLWDTFTGSASYRQILLRALHPFFFLRLGVATLGLLGVKVKDRSL